MDYLEHNGKQKQCLCLEHNGMEYLEKTMSLFRT